MFSNVRFILLTAVRDRLLSGMLLGLMAAAYIASLLGSTAMLENTQLTVSVAAATARLLLMIGCVVFIAFHVRNAYESREMEQLLSRPLTRTQVVLSFWLGFALLATVMVLPVIAVIAVLGILNPLGFAVWSLSLLLESWLVVTLGLFAALILRSAVAAVLASLAMYLCGRLMGFFLVTAAHGLAFHDSWVNTASKTALLAVSAVVPRLDFFAKTHWLVYGVQSTGELRHVLLQSAVTIPLLLTAAMVDFSRREF